MDFFTEKNVVYRAIRKGFRLLFRLLPVDRRKIVFDNFFGRGFGDDPKYIAQELHAREPELKFYWLVKDQPVSLPEWIRPVKIGTIRCYYHMSTAAVWVDNIKNIPKPGKRKGQFYVQTWHSTLGFKMNEQDAPTLPEHYRKRAMEDAWKTDLMYSDNDFRLEKYRTRYWYSGPVIKCDVPRMGILINTPEALRQQVYSHFGVSPEKKLVMYAPTFRKNTDLSIYAFDYEACISALEDRFGGEYVLLIRLHPNEAKRAAGLEIYRSGRILNASDYPDMQELLAVCDVLITDYSGCMFDFSFSGKPVFLLAQDLEAYLAEDRAAYFTLDQVPFRLARSSGELLSHIADFSEDTYHRECHKFKQRIGFQDSGNGARVIADIILEKMQIR